MSATSSSTSSYNSTVSLLSLGDGPLEPPLGGSSYYSSLLKSSITPSLFPPNPSENTYSDISNGTCSTVDADFVFSSHTNREVSIPNYTLSIDGIWYYEIHISSQPLQYSADLHLIQYETMKKKAAENFIQSSKIKTFKKHKMKSKEENQNQLQQSKTKIRERANSSFISYFNPACYCMSRPPLSPRRQSFHSTRECDLRTDEENIKSAYNYSRLLSSIVSPESTLASSSMDDTSSAPATATAATSATATTSTAPYSIPSSYIVRRRYNDFLSLYKQLTLLFPNFPFPPFPKKGLGILKGVYYFTGIHLEQSILEKRRRRLESFLQWIDINPLIAATNVYQEFLGEPPGMISDEQQCTKTSSYVSLKGYGSEKYWYRGFCELKNQAAYIKQTRKRGMYERRHTIHFGNAYEEDNDDNAEQKQETISHTTKTPNSDKVPRYKRTVSLPSVGSSAMSEIDDSEKKMEDEITEIIMEKNMDNNLSKYELEQDNVYSVSFPIIEVTPSPQTTHSIMCA